MFDLQSKFGVRGKHEEFAEYAREKGCATFE